MAGKWQSRYLNPSIVGASVPPAGVHLSLSSSILSLCLRGVGNREGGFQGVNRAV